VERIAQSAEENSAAVSEAATTASSLRTLATELEQKVVRFRV
jgi:methyl-accepting chemotaxis protein